MADRLPKNDQLAMDRRVAQLTMDYLYNTIIQTRSLSVTLQRIQVLRAEGLFPYPIATTPANTSGSAACRTVN